MLIKIVMPIPVCFSSSHNVSVIRYLDLRSERKHKFLADSHLGQERRLPAFTIRSSTADIEVAGKSFNQI